MIIEIDFLNDQKKYVEQICGTKNITFKRFYEVVSTFEDEMDIVCSITNLVSNEEVRKSRRWKTFCRLFDETYKERIRLFWILKHTETESMIIKPECKKMLILFIASLWKLKLFNNGSVDQLIHTCNEYFDLRIDKEKIKQEFYKLDVSMAEMVVQAMNSMIEKNKFKLKLDE